ncbi:MAG: VOC family protein [Rhodothermaceae bacterium]
MKFICALITVSDINRSKQFYTEVLDQKIKYDFGENVTFHGDFAIHLDTHFQQIIEGPEIRRDGHNFELYFENDRVDELEKKLESLNIKFVHKVREQPWRQKVLRFYDPDGNIIEVGESIEFLSFRLSQEGISLDKVAEITNMSVEFVKDSISQFS